jgi:NAD(P)H-dependent flavin oxidoreductase YrpB (nitropropane dioxygenase family)
MEMRGIHCSCPSEYGCAPAGQIAGMIAEIKSAKEIVKEIVAEAEKILRSISIGSH